MRELFLWLSFVALGALFNAIGTPCSLVLICRHTRIATVICHLRCLIPEGRAKNVLTRDKVYSYGCYVRDNMRGHGLIACLQINSRTCREMEDHTISSCEVRQSFWKWLSTHQNEYLNKDKYIYIYIYSLTHVPNFAFIMCSTPTHPQQGLIIYSLIWMHALKSKASGRSNKDTHVRSNNKSFLWIAWSQIFFSFRKFRLFGSLTVRKN